MAKFIVLIFFLLPSYFVFSQTIYSNVFIYASKSYIEDHYDLRDKPPFEYEAGTYFLLGYKHKIRSIRKLNIYFQYSKYRPTPYYSTRRNPNSFLLSEGWNIIYTNYIDIGIEKQVPLSTNRAYLNISLGIRKANIKTAWPYGSKTTYLGIIHYYDFPGNYYLPQLEIGLDFKIRKRWHITIMKMYTFGLYGRFQEVWFDYTFKGESLPRTITFINGTTKQFHLGIQFDIVKSDGTNSKKRKKKKRWKFKK